MWDLTVAWGEGLQDHWLNQQGSELAAERAPAALSPLDSAIPSAQGTLCLWFPQSSLTALAPVWPTHHTLLILSLRKAFLKNLEFGKSLLPILLFLI